MDLCRLCGVGRICYTPRTPKRRRVFDVRILPPSSIRMWMRAARADSRLMVVPDADRYLVQLIPGVRRGVNVSILIMRPPQTVGNPMVRARLAVLVKALAVRLLAVGGVQIGFLTATGKVAAKWLDHGVTPVQDPTPQARIIPLRNVELLREELGLAPVGEEVMLLVAGSVSERKNPQSLLQTVAMLNQSGTPSRLVLAGKVQASVLEAVQSSPYVNHLVLGPTTCQRISADNESLPRISCALYMITTGQVGSLKPRYC